MSSSNTSDTVVVLMVFLPSFFFLLNSVVTPVYELGCVGAVDVTTAVAIRDC